MARKGLYCFVVAAELAIHACKNSNPVKITIVIIRRGLRPTILSRYTANKADKQLTAPMIAEY
jgi:hypothetical protein